MAKKRESKRTSAKKQNQTEPGASTEKSAPTETVTEAVDSLEADESEKKTSRHDPSMVESDPGEDPEYLKAMQQSGLVITDADEINKVMEAMERGDDVLTADSFDRRPEAPTVQASRPQRPPVEQLRLPKDAPKDRNITLIGWSGYTEFQVPIQGEHKSVILEFPEPRIRVPQEVAELCQIEALRGVFIID